MSPKELSTNLLTGNVKSSVSGLKEITPTPAPRGIRNNNPGNIDYHASNDPWQGLADPPSDGRFCRFSAPVYGLRVLSKLLVAYADFHGCHTVRQFINRWAPPSENDTGAYVAAVAKSVGVGADTKIDIHDDAVRARMMAAIVQHENGQQPYAAALILEAAKMA